MKLSDVVKRFNQTPFFDAYTGIKLGVAQLDVFNDSMRDGMTVQRRVLEVEPGAQQPSRGVVEFHNTAWLTGITQLDSFKGSVIRKKWVLHKAEELASIFSLKNLLSDLNPIQAYAALVWEKTNSEVEIGSSRHNQLSIYLARAEDVPTDSIIWINGVYYTVLSSYPTAAGHQAAVSEQIEPNPLETITTKGDQWDPITETWTGGSTFKVFRLRWQSDFQYYSQATPNFERGDLQAASLERPKNGTQLEMSDGTWAVVGSQERNDVFYLHLRRA